MNTDHYEWLMNVVLQPATGGADIQGLHGVDGISLATDGVRIHIVKDPNYVGDATRSPLGAVGAEDIRRRMKSIRQAWGESRVTQVDKATPFYAKEGLRPVLKIGDFFYDANYVTKTLDGDPVNVEISDLGILRYETDEREAFLMRVDVSRRDLRPAAQSDWLGLLAIGDLTKSLEQAEDRRLRLQFERGATETVQKYDEAIAGLKALIAEIENKLKGVA